MPMYRVDTIKIGREVQGVAVTSVDKRQRLKEETRSQAVARIADRTTPPPLDHSIQNPPVKAAYQIWSH